MLEGTAYHMLLRVAALSLALVLLFDSGIISPVTKELANGTQQYLANAVGATASVKPTEVNELTAELTKQKRELEAREAALSERELNVGLTTRAEAGSDMSTYILSLILFVLLVLIVLNYALDFARQRRLMFIEEHEQNA